MDNDPRTQSGSLLARLADDDLLRLVARADYDAFTELYSRFERVAYAVALRVLRDPALAEDAVVDSMVAVWRSARTFSPERGRARTWILTIVHRRAVDIVRRESRTHLVELAPLVAPGADDDASLREERRDVQRAVAMLPDRERELIELAYYAGYTQSQLAELLGLSLGTVKSRMFAGLTRLRHALSEPGAVGADRRVEVARAG